MALRQNKIGELVAISQDMTASESLRINAFIRLAINQRGNPEQSLNLLNQAIEIQPDHAEALLFRAQLLQPIAPVAADYAYRIASDRNPSNPIISMRHAEYRMKRQQYDHGLDILLAGSVEAGPSIIQLQLYFWSSVTAPVRQPTANVHSAADQQFLDELWNSDHYFSASAEEMRCSLMFRPEISWLRIIESLTQGDLMTSKALLQTASQETKQFAPQLFEKLYEIISQHKQFDAAKPELINLFRNVGWQTVAEDLTTTTAELLREHKTEKAHGA